MLGLWNLFWMTPEMTGGIMVEIKWCWSGLGLWLCRKHELVSLEARSTIRRRMPWDSLVATAWASWAFELPVGAWGFADGPSSPEATVVKITVLVAGSQLGGQSAPQITKVAQPSQGSADQTRWEGQPHADVWSFFLNSHLKDFLIKGLGFLRRLGWIALLCVLIHPSLL